MILSLIFKREFTRLLGSKAIQVSTCIVVALMFIGGAIGGYFLRKNDVDTTPPEVTGNGSEGNPFGFVMGSLGVSLLMVMIFTGIGVLSAGVVEEKASRVVEILLTTVKPRVLLLGKILGIGTGMLVVFAATGTLRGLLDTRTPFVVATAGAALNVGLNALLLYGARMGIAGSGLGTALAQSAMAAALAAPVLRSARDAGVGLAPSRTGLQASLGSGAPLLVRTVSLRAAILTTVWAATALGAVPLAAHQVVGSLWNFAAFALDALAVAAQALVGTALGQADAAGARAPSGGSAPVPSGGAGVGAVGVEAVGTRAAPSGPTPRPSTLGGDAILRRTLGWGAATGAVIGVVLAAASPWLPWLFTSEAAVASAARPALLVAASAMPLAGAVFLFDGILMGAGDGRYLAGAGLVTLVPYAPLAVAVAHGLPAASPAGGLAWLWAAFAWVFMGARGLTTGLRARGTAWRR